METQETTGSIYNLRSLLRFRSLLRLSQQMLFPDSPLDKYFGPYIEHEFLRRVGQRKI